MPSEVAGSASASASSSWRKKPWSLSGALEVGDDDALDGHRGAGDRRRGAVALDVVDAGVMSSLTIVPWPWPSVTMALVTLVTLTKKVSLVSGRRVAVDQDVEGVGRAAGGDRLAGQRLGRVVARVRPRCRRRSRCRRSRRRPGAGAERLTVKVKVVVPALPSLSETSLIVRFGGVPRGAA